MGHKHLPWSRLRAELATGTLQRGSIAQILDHLAAICPECHAQMIEMTSTLSAGDNYSQAFADRLAVVEEAARRLDHSMREAERDLAALLKLDPERRRFTIDRSRSHYRSPFLVDLLLNECRKWVTSDPIQALELAECAHAVSLRIPHTGFGEVWAITCTARATAYRGNALRAIGEFQQGARLIQTAREMIEQQGYEDPYVEAEMYSLLASVSKDLGSFDEALRHTDHVIATYDLVKDEPAVGRALVQKSTIYRDSGDVTQALATVEEALVRISAADDQAIYLMARHNRAHYLVELGRFDEARNQVVENEGLFTGTTALIRHQWLLGKIAHGLKQLDRAESTFAEVRERFLKEGLSFDAALAGLDLALVYLDSGQLRELRALSESMVPIFRAQSVERETIAALLLFQEAARQEVVTRSMLEELASYMQRAQRRPRQPARTH